MVTEESCISRAPPFATEEPPLPTNVESLNVFIVLLVKIKA